MTSDERTYLLAIKAELPIAISGGILSMCIGIANYFFGNQWIALLICSVLLAFVVWYDVVFKGRYSSLISNSVGRFSLAISICYLIFDIITQNINLTIPTLNAYNLYVLFALTLFWFGMVHTFMVRTGMRRWIPSLFTSIMLLLSYVLATELHQHTDLAIVLLNTTVATMAMAIAGLLYHLRFRLGSVALISMFVIVVSDYLLFALVILSALLP